MDKEELKKLHPGQVLYLLNYPVTLKGITSEGVSAKDDQAEGSDGNWCYFPAKYIATEPIHPENDTKNTENAPKYDQNRKFRKGDVVRVVERNGRYQPNIPVDEFWSGLLTVSEDENFCNNLVKVRSEDGREKLSHWWYLELVTPVEELGPYSVRHNEAHAAWSIYGTFGLSAVNYFYGERYPYTQEQAKAAAEAERDRLNAAYRKEKE